MRLYVHSAACSLSPHIVIRELGLDVDIVHVDRATRETEDGRDFLKVNPNGYVPALELDDGEIIIEGPAIVQYLIDLKPASDLAPRDARERRRLQSLLNFVSTEIHKPMVQMFGPAYAPVKDVLKKHVSIRLDSVEASLGGGFLAGDRMSAADIYLHVCLNWAQWLGIDLSAWPRVQALMRGINRRPRVLDAFAAERLAPLPDGIFFAPIK